MTNDTQQIVNKAWNFAHVLRDNGLSYMAYTEQITFLLFNAEQGVAMMLQQTGPYCGFSEFRGSSATPAAELWRSATEA